MSSPPPGATDDDCSFDEAFVYTFDVGSQRFLSNAGVVRIWNYEDMMLVPTSATSEFDLYHTREGLLEHCKISVDGTMHCTWGPVLRPASNSGATSYSVRSVSGDVAYLVQAGNVLRLSLKAPKTFPIEPPAQGFHLKSPALSGDGRLMFVLTARVIPQDVIIRGGTRPDDWTGRVTVYHTDTFEKVREGEISWATYDLSADREGKTLYRMSRSVGLEILDAQNFKVVKELALSEEPFGDLLVVP